MDYTFTPHLLNNFTFGIQSNNEYNQKPSDPHIWDNYGYNGQIVTLPIFSAGTYIYNALPDGRNNPVWQASDTMTWVHGKHTMSFGGNFLNSSFFLKFPTAALHLRSQYRAWGRHRRSGKRDVHDDESAVH